jgi:hypothetical protein
MTITFFRWWAISQRMLLIDALRELRTRSAERLNWHRKRRAKKSVSDQGSLAGSTMALGNVINLTESLSTHAIHMEQEVRLQ